MYRLNENDLALKIDLAVSRGFDRHGKLLSTRADRGHLQRLIASEVKNDLVNHYTCVVLTDSAGGYNPTRGVFGRDEPWPAQLEMERYAAPGASQEGETRELQP